MEFLRLLHGVLGNTIFWYLVLIGLWGLGLGLRGRGPSASYTGALVIAEIGAIAQGLPGLALLLGRAPGNSLHVLYGFALAAALPLAATFTRDRQPRAISFAFGFIALFAAGLAVRGMTTAG